MAQGVATFNTSANYSPGIAWTFDVRQMVEDFADLLIYNSSHYLVNGFTVMVQGKTNSDERGFYQLMDYLSHNQASSWKRVDAPWFWSQTYNCFIKKASGNTDYSKLETDDFVMLKTVNEFATNTNHLLHHAKYIGTTLLAHEQLSSYEITDFYQVPQVAPNHVGWFWLSSGSCDVLKGNGNSNFSVIENGDKVRYKEVTFEGEQTVLAYATYNGGSTSDFGSYTPISIII